LSGHWVIAKIIKEYMDCFNYSHVGKASPRLRHPAIRNLTIFDGWLFNHRSNPAGVAALHY
jgi:hypothetical protein